MHGSVVDLGRLDSKGNIAKVDAHGVIAVIEMDRDLSFIIHTVVEDNSRICW